MRCLVAVLVFLAVLSGCASDNQPISLNGPDDLGREVVLPEDITRIIPLAPNLTEMLYAIGAGDRIIAVSPSDNFPVEVDSLP